MKRPNYFYLIFFSLLLGALTLFLVNTSALAQVSDVYGLDSPPVTGMETADDLDLKDAISRAISFVLGFLGLIAVVVVMYAGFLWMTSGGAVERIDRAKRMLKNGLIGLLIIIFSWAIVTLVINTAINFPGIGSGVVCQDGDTKPCGCGGVRYCFDGAWGVCEGSDCSTLPPGTGGSSCDANPLTPECDIDNDACDPSWYCDGASCTCKALGSIGSPCSSDPLGSCVPDNNLCGQYLTCSDACVCEGGPVILDIIPVGGFCSNNINTPCLSNDDCGAGTCDTTTPNGAIDNFITIFGLNFGDYQSGVSQVLFFNNSLPGGVPGNLPSDINPTCSNHWTDTQIIIAIPAGVDLGPIVVKTADGQEDSSNAGPGPVLVDFQPNNIARPGLCEIDPQSGVADDLINYQGINLFNGEAYFGSYTQNIKAADSNFNDSQGITGSASVPYIGAGQASTFVAGTIAGFLQKSNYLYFTKNQEPQATPFISSFEPSQGTIGQYITIYGSGFGDFKGNSSVYLGGNEVNYTFPEVCANSVWDNNKIIVKVPEGIANGDYTINLNIGSLTISSEQLNPDKFTVNTSLPLPPSLCRVSPIRGQADYSVKLWGEYFGQTNSSAQAVFHVNKLFPGLIQKDGTADLLEAKVPVGAITGPLKVVNTSNLLASNNFNFEIGPCQTDADCGLDICCPAGTFKANRCETTLNDCSLDIPSSVFEWSFSTGFSGDGGNGVGIDSCEGLAHLLGACQVDEFCPNSPGLCSISPFGQAISSCDSSCNSISDCVGNQCTFVSSLDKCNLNGSTCSADQPFTYELGGGTYETTRSCQLFSGQGHWYIPIKTSCPSGWINIGYGCRSIENCNACIAGFSCADLGSGGTCVSSKLCSASATCVNDECLRNQSFCECCCEIGQSESDCCYPLQCEGTCGSDLADDGVGLGRCSGCTTYVGGVIDQALSNSACNCPGFSGKYCDTNIGSGVCVDCSNLGEDDCRANSDQCCFDAKTSACRGGSGQIISSDPSDPNFGSCAYYDCDAADPGTCAIDAPTPTGDYFSQAACESGCPSNYSEAFCNQFSYDKISCDNYSFCCYNFATEVCSKNDPIVGGDDNGYCPFYNCQTAEPTLCDANPLLEGTYNSLSACDLGCASSSGLGLSCFNRKSLTCQASLCGFPFSCLQEDGSTITSLDTPPDCGTCCCSMADPIASCNLGIPNTSLVCQPNQSPCTGDNRGLCCGCTQDADCGDEAFLGCGYDTCCRARPSVLSDQVLPPTGAVNVCRNAMLTIPFDQRMDAGSFGGNVMLLEEHDSGPCPTGTFIFTENLPQKSNFLTRFLVQVKSLWNRYFYSPALDTALALTPDSSKLYCLVPGVAQYENLVDSSILYYYPRRLLKDNTNYFFIVKGYESAENQSLGVLSYWGIAMNGPGLLVNGSFVPSDSYQFNQVTYSKAYITSFKTMSDQATNSGVCTVDYASVTPPSYLFNTSENDLNENDANPGDSTFDTVRDKDKLFTAKAYSFDGQAITPTTGYYWEWDFELEKTGVADIDPVVGLKNNQAFLSVIDGVQDDSTFLRATVKMDRFSVGSACNSASSCVCDSLNNCSSNCCNFDFTGDGTIARSNINVFICRNPWPAVNPDYSWSPWVDLYNYKFYYCRDDGGPTLADDLPAIIDPAVIQGASNSICSVSGASCSNLGGPCGPDNSGICIWNVLRESYFFRQTTPSAGQITEAINQAVGNTILLKWEGNSDLIYNSNPAFMGTYRIYYSQANAGSFSYIEIKPSDPVDPDSGLSTQACTPVNPSAGQNYTCQRIVRDLENNKSYIFRVSAVSRTKTETFFRNQKTVTPTDQVPPSVPSGCSFSLITNDNTIKFTCSIVSADTKTLRLYHGVSPNLYGQSFDFAVDEVPFSVSVDAFLFKEGTNYFTVSALDGAGNESAKSNMMNATIQFFQCYCEGGEECQTCGQFNNISTCENNDDSYSCVWSTQ